MGLSETCPSRCSFVSLGGDVMLKVSWLATVAYFLFGAYSKSEGQTWQ